MITITRKAKIIAAMLIGALALYALVGFYLLPALVRSQLPVLLAEKTGQQVRLQAVRLNPFSFRLELEGFSLSAPDGKSLFGFDALSADVDALASLIGPAAVFDAIVLRKPAANIERRADGSFNFSGMLPADAAAPEEKKDSGTLPLTIHRLMIEEGQMVWQDMPAGQPQTETLLPVNLTITELTTQGTGGAAFDLDLGLASGGHLQWQGDLNLAPVASKGRINLEDIALPKVWQLFLQAILPVEIADGRVTLQTEYQASLADSGLALSGSNGAVNIKQLEITEKGQAVGLLTIPAVALGGIAFDLNKQQISVASLTSNDAQVNAWLQKDGKVNYQSLFVNDAATAAAQTAVPTAAPAGPAWQISLDELALNNYQIRFTDYTQSKPVELLLSGLDFKLQKYSNQPGGKLPLQLAARFNNSGKLNVGGDIIVEPFSAALALDIKGIDLKPFQSYLDSYLNLELVDGDLSGQGDLRLAAADELQLGFHGDANLANLITRDKIKNKDFVKWNALQLQQIDIDLAKRDYKLGKVSFDRPYARFTIKKDGTTNINDIVVPQLANKDGAAKPADAKKSQKPQAQPNISIGKIELKDGKSDFADYSLILPFVAEMNALNGEINGFSSSQDTAAKLVLRGKVYDLATVGIKGNYQFQSGDSAIELNFTHMPLPLITPYMAQFAGYKIEKGQMALDLQYKIKKGRLEAQNKVFIDQLTLGETVENPNAVSLPLHLAVALLKDADGKINLDFPVTGSLEDPQFSVGSLITDVLVNLISKVVMSPFHALGSLLNDEQDFSAVSFAAGSAELQAEETVKLDQLGKALQNKSELILEVKGMAYQAQDWPVMRFDAVKDILKKMKSGELRDKGERVRSEYIELSEDEYKRLLAKFFKEVFPQEIDYSLLGKPRIKAQPDADFYSVARQKLEAIMQPEPQRLSDLAVARANSISKYLTEKGNLDRGRVYILAPELDPAGVAGIVSVLSLNVAP